MKRFALALVCTALATPAVFAQAKYFEGFSLSAGLSSTKTTFSDSSGDIDGTTTGLDLNAHYHWTLGQEFVLGLGFSIGTGNNKAGTTSLGSEVSTKSRYAIDFTPGFAASKDVLVFGKISLLNATAEASTFSEGISGIGYGVGLRVKHDPALFWSIGYDLNQYAEKNSAVAGTYKAKSSVLSLGVGYQF